jgi:rfaE bifunctional protein nucleotidyltransferase chain/domain
VNVKNKVLEESDIEFLVKEKKSAGLRIGLCHGVFDLLHVGHISHFREAKDLVDCLIVSVTSDYFVNKGPGRPLFSQQHRIDFLKEIELIDFIILSKSATAEDSIRKIRPDLYFKGSDYERTNEDITGKIQSEIDLVQSFGGKVHFTHGFTSSSSRLINSSLSPLSASVTNWISDFKSKYTTDEIFSYLDEISKLNVVLVGETIIDKYTFVEALGKTTKDPLLAFHVKETLVFPGGVLAIASYLQNWVKSLTLITCVGKNAQQINKELENIACSPFLIKTQSPNITKHRYLDQGTKQKLFETYDFDPNYFTANDISKELPAEVIRSADNVIVADYGHGMLESSTLRLISSLSSFLCVNVQANAGNRGFNRLDKYPRFDFFTANSGEIQIQSRAILPDYEELIRKIMFDRGASHAILTQGERGLTVYNQESVGFAPALATNVVDKIGAGDSVLAISSLLVRIGAPLQVIAFISNLVAANAVSQLGHQKSLALGDLKKQVKSLLS